MNIKSSSTAPQIGYHTLYVAASSCDAEGRQTVPHLVPLAQPRHKVGGYSNVATRATTYTFTHKGDREHAALWLLNWAQQRGLDCAGII